MNLKLILDRNWNFIIQASITHLTMILVALSAVVLVFVIPPPASTIKLIYEFHFQIAVLLIAFLGFILARKGVVWDTISLTIVLILFCVPVLYNWLTATYNGEMFGGLIPWSDAQGYYSGAHQLMITGHLSSWTTRRPLFGGFLSVLFSITGNNLQFSLIILAIINGLSVFLTSRVIQKVYGAGAAAVFVGICYWYYCSIAGKTMSEQIGLCFGSIGLAILIHGTQNNSLSKSAYGVFLLTVALNARAGAFFILPVIALWFGINFKNTLGWRKPIAVGIAAIAIGMAGNLAMAKAVGSPDGAPFSNYSYTLYGLATGNTGWRQVLTDYPGVREDQVFDLAVQKIKESPSLFFIGILRSYQDFFTTEYGLFSFLSLVNDKKNVGNQLLWVFTWIGLGLALLQPKKGQNGLILAGFLGILLSVSLVPPKDANSMRIYAATIPFTIYIASTSVAFPAQIIRKIETYTREPVEDWLSPKLLQSLSILLIAICFPGPLIVKLNSYQQKPNTPFLCPSGNKEILFFTGHGSSVSLVDDQAINETYVPDIQISAFRNRIELGPSLYSFLSQELASLDTGYTVSMGTYQTPKSANPDIIQSGYILTNGPEVEPGFHQICVSPAHENQLIDIFFYRNVDQNKTNQPDPAVFNKYPIFVKIVRNLYGVGILGVGISALLGVLGFRSLKPMNQFFVIVNIVLVFIGVLVNLHSTAIIPLSWERISLDMVRATRSGGYSYKLPLGIDWMDRRELGESPAIVYENDIPLKRPNSTWTTTKKLGKGRYSIQDGFLIFSASDNSNPRTNGRRYELYWPVPISLTLRRISYALATISVFFLLLQLHKPNQDS
jgi:hypothetical protein